MNNKDKQTRLALKPLNIFIIPSRVLKVCKNVHKNLYIRPVKQLNKKVKKYSASELINCKLVQYASLFLRYTSSKKVSKVVRKNLFFTAKANRIRYRLSYLGGACQYQLCLHLRIDKKPAIIKLTVRLCNSFGKRFRLSEHITYIKFE